jgi:hypothetical protein
MILPKDWNPEILGDILIQEFAKEFNCPLDYGKYQPWRITNLFWRIKYYFTGLSPIGHQKASLLKILFRILGIDIWLAVFFWGSFVLLPAFVPLVIK